MQGWYGPPIAVAGVPGSVWACGDGDFRGPIACGQFASGLDFALGRLKRILRPQYGRLNMGFSSITDLVSPSTQRRIFPFTKTGNGNGTFSGDACSLWRFGALPPAAGNASNAPGGDAPTSATTGAFGFSNPASGETQHLAKRSLISSQALHNLLLYDRIFQVNKTMSSTDTEAVTGVPTRYQSQTGTDPAFCGGNFMFVEIGATLSNLAHNWTTCLYNDQGGASSTFASVTGRAADATAGKLDHTNPQWFTPLEAGDSGVKALTQMQCSASITGTINFVVGHPIAWMPIPLLNAMCNMDGINSAFSLVRIFDDAALAFLELYLTAVDSACTYRGQFETVSG